MTQNFPDYYNPAPAQPLRPTSVTVLAILGIIFSALGILCTPLAVIPYFTNFGVPNPAIDSIKNNGPLFAWILFSTALGWLISILLLAGSIGALNLKPWARKGLIAWAWVAIATGVIGLIVTVLFLLPQMMQAAAKNPSAGAGMKGGLVGGVFGNVIGMVFPILMLVFMGKPHVVAAFDRNEPTATT